MNEPRERDRYAALDPESKIRIRGADCVRRLVTLLRTVRSHGTNNTVFQRQVPEFLENFEFLLELSGEAVIASQKESIVVNDVRLPERVLPTPVTRALLGELNRLQLSGVCLLPGLDGPQVTTLVERWAKTTDEARPGELEQQLLEDGVTSVTLIPFGREGVAGGGNSHVGGAGTGTGSGRGASVAIGGDGVGLDGRGSGGGPASGVGVLGGVGGAARAARIYETAFQQTEGLLRKTQETGVPDLHAAVRVMQPVVDSILRHEYAIIGLTAIRKHDDYTYRHSLNVGLLAVAMGKALQLDRRPLAELGMTGLLHDLGKIDVPLEILKKRTRLAEAEWRVLQRHPLIGARRIARMPGMSRLMCDAIEVCLQHHVTGNGSGYPRVPGMRQSAASKIVAVADCFDALAAQRAYHERPLTPFQSLQYVSGHAGIRFDAGAVWALGQAVGRYPPGSVLMTKTGFVVLVLSPNPDDVGRPFCRVLRHADGTLVTSGDPMLWSPLPAEERIARVLQPEECPIDPQAMLAA